MYSYQQGTENEVDLLAHKQAIKPEVIKDSGTDHASHAAVRPSGTYTIFHKKHHVAATKPNQACLDESDALPQPDEAEKLQSEHFNKLWLIVKSLKLGDKNHNRFYLSGGEIFKLGRVVMRVLEANMEQAHSQSASVAQLNQSREDNTQMSFAEINEGPEGHQGAAEPDAQNNENVRRDLAEMNLDIERAASSEQQPVADDEPYGLASRLAEQEANDDQALDLMRRPTHFERRPESGGEGDPGNEGNAHSDQQEEHKQEAMPTLMSINAYKRNPAQLNLSDENLTKGQQDNIIQFEDKNEQ